MPDWELFVHLAEIAGIFVGFGALISIRGAGDSDVHEMEYLRGITSGGLWVLFAAMVPLTLSRFGLEGRGLWTPSAVAAFALFVTFWVVDARSAENRAERVVHRAVTIRYAAAAVPMTMVLLGSLLLAASGALPAQSHALYFLAVVTALLEQGLTLLMLVWTNHVGTPGA